MVRMTQMLPPFTKVLLSIGSNKHRINQGKPDQHSALSTHTKLRSNVQLSLPPISPSPHLPISLSPYPSNLLSLNATRYQHSAINAPERIQIHKTTKLYSNSR
ncbi:hypothetical protein [Moorena sp. SIO3I6]|uniref:hypothetical protein n=1 Tax=Moorena sp. SIO3I6 TaxID=2607831 RepID=UPI0013FC7253|nr:hypothetical protein [Moorena sp. SIO3I6]NEP29445.1 hypothetical protein [Moorena sp. SIO3I6]